ncbi:hypothetical protein FPHYL_4953 [Fusarium phyllophilum]|uniref:Uncharacterized protein n=1 Tax=Fusarium phyllophilum TaxID=47803 RepID=A0A8H5K2M6_9HYPO|nr:hypothetical protein FPHYL_4953 [Fusarium phyllophilum]
MAKEQRSKIFACVSDQTPEQPIDSHGELPKSTKAGEVPIFGLYVPSDIADAATVQFQEQTKAFQVKRDFYMNRYYPHMPWSHRDRFNAKEYQALQRLKTSLAKSLSEAKYTTHYRVERYIRKNMRKEEGDLTDEEVKQVMASWKDGSEMPNIEVI